jgi:tRNA-dihydrouridine synthase
VGVPSPFRVLICALNFPEQEQRGQFVGDADWDYIAAVKRAVGIPVILNGNISSKADADRAMQV